MKTLAGHSSQVNSVAISPDGKWIASASDDETVKVRSVTTGQVSRSLEGHIKPVTSVAISPDGKWIVSGSTDKTIKVRDSSTLQLKYTIKDILGLQKSIVISHSGRFIFSISKSQKIKVYDSASGELKKTIEERSFRIALSPDDSLVACTLSDGLIRVRSTETGELVCAFSKLPSLARTMKFLPDGKTIVVGHGSCKNTDRVVSILDIPSGQIKQILDGHSMSVSSVSVSDDGAMIETSDLGKNTITWSLVDEKFVRTTSTFISAANAPGVDPALPNWSKVDCSEPKNWIRHGRNMMKVTDSLFDWGSRVIHTHGSLFMIKEHPVVIEPIHSKANST
ncbi:WD40-repeat-containing domain protein [Polychytrium aggregatum]|uniref:WD40-repeat-containing domain protein n=1 Tax=Polychytrium aggregatum TaxID=110093 RepID=UPI0022FEA351|nr:WD40-repeat-containing domain protein [Polychytrium aggregatum]KAI9208731.1 WD40-repeat-containing domain protein [Polychytrium aggregatum]